MDFVVDLTVAGERCGSQVLSVKKSFQVVLVCVLFNRGIAPLSPGVFVDKRLLQKARVFCDHTYLQNTRWMDRHSMAFGGVSHHIV